MNASDRLSKVLARLDEGRRSKPRRSVRLLYSLAYYSLVTLGLILYLPLLLSELRKLHRDLH